MRRTISKIQNFLSLKWVTVLVVLFSIISRILHVVFFFNIRIDRSYQLLATQNLVAGNGVTTASVLPSDLSTIIYSPLIKWPPGYSFLLAPFYSLFGNDYLVSALVLDLISGIILIFVSRSILKLFDTPVYLVNIFSIISSVFIYYFYFITSSDGIAITFFIIALYYSLLFLKNRLNWIKTVILISLFFFLSAFIKYLFMPVVLGIPVFFIIKGIADKNKKVLKTGVVASLVLLTSFAGIFLYQKGISGSAGYVSDEVRGFFPKNLLAAYPFVPGSLVKSETFSALFNNYTLEKKVIPIFQVLYVLFLISTLYYCIKSFYQQRFKKMSLAKDFMWLSVLIGAITVLLLAFLSLRVAKNEDPPGSWWTFIQEPRYYGLPNVLLLMALFIFLPYYIHNNKKLFRYAFIFLWLLLLPEVFRGAIFTIKRAVNFGRENYSWQTDLNFQKYAATIIEKEQQKSIVKKIVVTGSVYFMNNRVSLYSHIPILQEHLTINNLSSLQTKEKVLLLIVLNDTNLQYYQPFISSQEKQEVGKFNGFHFYTTYVEPN